MALISGHRFVGNSTCCLPRLPKAVCVPFEFASGRVERSVLRRGATLRRLALDAVRSSPTKAIRRRRNRTTPRSRMSAG